MMRFRFRKLRPIVLGSLAWAGETIELGDVLTCLGLILLGVGLWRVSPAAGLAVPGAVLIWYALPTRPPFVSARPRAPKDGS